MFVAYVEDTENKPAAAALYRHNAVSSADTTWHIQLYYICSQAIEASDTNPIPN